MLGRSRCHLQRVPGVSAPHFYTKPNLSAISVFSRKRRRGLTIKRTGRGQAGLEPESSMLPVWAAGWRPSRSGRRAAESDLVCRLLLDKKEAPERASVTLAAFPGVDQS